MSISVTQLEKKDYPRYNDLVRTSPQGSLWAETAWADYCGATYEVWGCFRGCELIAGGLIPHADGKILRYLPGTPWTGLVARRGLAEAEGECLSCARGMATALRARHDEVTLTLSPEWTDVRGFTWEGYKTHVRYTYRGGSDTKVEKRLRLRPTEITSMTLPFEGKGDWAHTHLSTEDSTIEVLTDRRYAYYWKANKGGKFHKELIAHMITLSPAFDLVGCNSPDRGLFKRQFGGRLTPYFAVTTSDVADLRA